MITDTDKKTASAAKITLWMAILLIILQGAAFAISMRYAYISTDILAQTEAKILIITAAVLSPSVTYLRYAFLLWSCFTLGQKQSMPMFVCAVVSLLAGAGADIFQSARNDSYFSGNESYYILAAGLSFTVSLCAMLFLWVYAADKGKKYAKDPKKKRHLLPVFAAASVTLFLIDALYRTYTVIEMALSDSGLSFEGIEDILYLIYDYLYPLGEAVLGFGIMCLCGMLFGRLFVKKTGKQILQH